MDSIQRRQRLRKIIDDVLTGGTGADEDDDVSDAQVEEVFVLIESPGVSFPRPAQPILTVRELLDHLVENMPPRLGV